jgi:hypothetical protein
MVCAVIAAIALATVAFTFFASKALRGSVKPHGGSDEARDAIDLVVNAQVMEQSKAPRYDGGVKAKEAYINRGKASFVPVSFSAAASNFGSGSSQKLIYDCDNTACSSTAFESFISREMEDIEILRKCLLNNSDVEEQSKHRQIFDLRCINRAGNFEASNYYHNVIDCLFPMAPTLAHVLNLPAKHMNDTILITNSRILQSWISLLTKMTPYFVTSSTVISLPIRRLPSNDRTTGTCIPLIHLLGRYATRSRNVASNRRIVVFIVRAGFSRDVKNIREFKQITTAVLGPSVEIINFYGNESVKDTFRLFQSAQVVVGYHGAGLANTAFCKNDTLVIEISLFMDLNMTKHWRTNSEVGILNKGLTWNTIWLPLNATGFASENEIMIRATRKKLDLDHFIKERPVVIPREYAFHVASTIKKFMNV